MTNSNGSNQTDGYEEITAKNASDHLAVYTLGGLTAEEEADLEYLIGEDPELALELAQFSEVSDSLASFGKPMAPSISMEEMLFKRVEANAQARFMISPTSTQIFKARIPQKKKEPTWSSWVQDFFGQPTVAFSLVTCLLVLAGLAGLLSARLNSVSGTIQALRGEVASEQAAVDSLESEVAKLNQEVGGSSVIVETYKTQLTDVLLENQQLLQANSDAILSRDEVATQVAGLISQNENLLGRNASLEERIATQDQILSLFSSPSAQTVRIEGTDTSPGSSATIVFNPETDLSILVVNDLPELGDGQVYQVLLVRGTEHDTSETFSVDAGGEHILIVNSPSPMSVFDTVGVSIEPVGGSDQRTGEVVLAGPIAGQN